VARAERATQRGLRSLVGPVPAPRRKPGRCRRPCADERADRCPPSPAEDHGADDGDRADRRSRDLGRPRPLCRAGDSRRALHRAAGPGSSAVRRRRLGARVGDRRSGRRADGGRRRPITRRSAKGSGVRSRRRGAALRARARRHAVGRPRQDEPADRSSAVRVRVDHASSSTVRSCGRSCTAPCAPRATRESSQTHCSTRRRTRRGAHLTPAP
jgi:hypothetical protein